MANNNNQSVPDVSIDKALELYLSIAMNGMKDGEEKDKLLAIMQEKIAKDRPEWAKRYANENQSVSEAPPDRYAAVKAQIVAKANAEEIPQDPEEKYLYLRRREAKENSLRKKETEKEVLRDEALRVRLIDQKQMQDEEVLKRAALIKKAILEKAKQRLSPQFETQSTMTNTASAVDATQQKVIGFSEPIKTVNQNTLDELPSVKERLTNEKAFNHVKPDSQEWFKNFKSLSMEDRSASIKEYNIRKREMLQTREELLHSKNSQKKDEGFSLDYDSSHNTGLSFEADKKKGMKLNLE
jgi:hypothetical protein